MATIPDVGFVAALLGAGIMALGFHLFYSRIRRATVVTCKEDQGVVRLSGFLQRIQHAADFSICLHDVVRVSAKTALAFPCRSRYVGIMRRARGEIDEEGLRALGILVEFRHSAIAHRRQYV